MSSKSAAWFVAALPFLVFLKGVASAQATTDAWTQVATGSSSAHASDHRNCGRIVQASWTRDGRQNNQLILWMGTARGGLWKSKVDPNGDVSKWIPLTESFPGSHGMGSFLVNRTNSEKILIGPGGFSSADNGDPPTGKIYRTTNQGGAWDAVNFPLKGAKPPEHICRLREDRSDSTGDTVLACTSAGVFRSTDFGKSWSRSKPPQGQTFSEVTDLVQDTGNSQIWYAAELDDANPILRSINGGANWEVYGTGAFPFLGSLARISLAAAESNPNILYALVASKDNTLNGLYISRTSSQTWNSIFGDNNVINSDDQSFHTCAVACDPTDAGHVICGMASPLEIFNATAPDINDRIYNSSLNVGHSDCNYFLFRPGRSNIVACNDGGYYIYHPSDGSLDDFGNLLGIEANWIASDYGGLESSRSDPAEYVAGLQDNGIILGDATFGIATELHRGDGNQVSIKPDASGVIAASISGDDRRDITFDSGDTWNEISNNLGGEDHHVTVLIDPTPGLGLLETNVFTYSLEATTSRVYYRPWFDTASPWAFAGPYRFPGTITRLDHTTNPSRHDLVLTLEGDRHVYVLTGPRAQLGGLEPDMRIPGLSPSSNGMKDARVNADRSAAQPDTIYYTTGTTRPSQAFVSTNCGKTWTEVTANMHKISPDTDFYKLICNPQNPKQLFLATGRGVFETDPSTGKWHAFSEGLRPHELIQDIVITPSSGAGSRTLYIATKGRGFWRRLVP